MDGGAWWAAVHGVAKSRTGLSDFAATPTNQSLATFPGVLALYQAVGRRAVPAFGRLAGFRSLSSV